MLHKLGCRRVTTERTPNDNPHVINFMAWHSLQQLPAEDCCRLHQPVWRYMTPPGSGYRASSHLTFPCIAPNTPNTPLHMWLARFVADSPTPKKSRQNAETHRRYCHNNNKGIQKHTNLTSSRRLYYWRFPNHGFFYVALLE